jgi:endonuclease/exonuclease/phosphatase family metal-dependent hydrolase
MKRKTNFAIVKNSAIVFLLLLFDITITVAQQNTSPQRAIVGFYNLENLFDTVNDPKTIDEEFLPEGTNNWTTERYGVKLANMSKVVASFYPDILGVSEIENRKVLEDLVAHPNIVSKRYQIVHFDMSDDRGVDVALLYRASVFKPFIINRLRIKNPEDANFKTRDILWVKGLCLGDTLHVAVNHWPSRRGGKEDMRLIAARVLRNAVDSVLAINPKANIVILGDFNDDPNNRSIKKILMASDSNEKKSSLVNTAEPTFKKGYGSLSFNGVWNLFDQVIISRALNDQSGIDYSPESFTIYAQRWMMVESGKYKGTPSRTFSSGVFNPEGYSDHLPVFILLRKY